MTNTSVFDPINNPNIYKFSFRRDVYVLANMTKTMIIRMIIGLLLSGKFVKWQNDTSPEGICGLINKVNVGLYATDHKLFITLRVFWI